MLYAFYISKKGEFMVLEGLIQMTDPKVGL